MRALKRRADVERRISIRQQHCTPVATNSSVTLALPSANQCARVQTNQTQRATRHPCGLPRPTAMLVFSLTQRILASRCPRMLAPLFRRRKLHFRLCERSWRHRQTAPADQPSPSPLAPTSTRAKDYRRTTSNQHTQPPSPFQPAR